MDHTAPTLALPHRVKGRAVIDARGTVTHDELLRMNAYWHAANYLSVRQIDLYDNPLLSERL